MESAVDQGVQMSANIHVQVSTASISLVSGFGGVLTFYISEYSAAGKDYADITQLMTYPTLFMYVFYRYL